jgi:hypothetical protein
MSIDDYKQCRRCLELKHRDAFYKRIGRAAQYGDGLMSHCKKCHGLLARLWRKEHPERVRELQHNASGRYAAKKREGRPPRLPRPMARSGEKRSAVLMMRVSDQEYKDIEALAHWWGCSMSAAARRVLREECISRGLMDESSPLFL